MERQGRVGGIKIKAPGPHRGKEHLGRGLKVVADSTPHLTLQCQAMGAQSVAK